MEAQEWFYTILLKKKPHKLVAKRKMYMRGEIKYLLPVGSSNMLYTKGHKPIIYHSETSTSFILKPSSPFKFNSFFKKYTSLDWIIKKKNKQTINISILNIVIKLRYYMILKTSLNLKINKYYRCLVWGEKWNIVDKCNPQKKEQNWGCPISSSLIHTPTNFTLFVGRVMANDDSTLFSKWW